MIEGIPGPIGEFDSRNSRPPAVSTDFDSGCQGVPVGRRFAVEKMALRGGQRGLTSSGMHPTLVDMTGPGEARRTSV